MPSLSYFVVLSLLLRPFDSWFKDCTTWGCNDEAIRCPDEDCFIYCPAFTCQSAVIFDSTGYLLHLTCQDNYACNEAVVYAQDASQFIWNCTGIGSCGGTIVYYPTSTTPRPTSKPTPKPTVNPTANPTVNPLTKNPTSGPTSRPTSASSTFPSQPTVGSLPSGPVMIESTARLLESEDEDEFTEPHRDNTDSLEVIIIVSVIVNAVFVCMGIAYALRKRISSHGQIQSKMVDIVADSKDASKPKGEDVAPTDGQMIASDEFIVRGDDEMTKQMDINHAIIANDEFIIKGEDEIVTEKQNKAVDDIEMVPTVEGINYKTKTKTGTATGECLEQIQEMRAVEEKQNQVADDMEMIPTVEGM